VSNRIVRVFCAVAMATTILPACSGSGGAFSARDSSSQAAQATIAPSSTPTSVPLPPADRCGMPDGLAKTFASITGEDWPGNPYDPGGADNDDYSLTFSGAFVVDAGKKQIGTKAPASITVVYSKDVNKTPCKHKLVFKLRRCPSKDSTVFASVEMDAKRDSSASTVIQVPEAAYIDINLITTEPNGGKKEINLYETQGLNFTFK
jgi:hypothetical protein